MVPFEFQLYNLLPLPLFEGRGDLAPRHVKLYSNHPNIVDFSDAETLRPHLDFALLEGEIGVVEYPLRVAAFTSVHSLSLLFVCSPLILATDVQLIRNDVRPIQIRPQRGFISLASEVTCVRPTVRSAQNSMCLPLQPQTRPLTREQRRRSVGSLLLVEWLLTVKL